MLDIQVILSVETATRRGSVCVTRGDEIIASEVGPDQSSHSNTLLREISQVLERSHILLSEVGVFAAAIGPGSFTGLRIGLASVKALAVTLGRPGVGVPTLHAVARSGGPSAVTVALLPAGRGELFAQMFAVSPGETVVELDRPAHLSTGELLKRYGGQPRIRWCGEGAHARRTELQEWASDQGISYSEMAGDALMNRDGWTLAPPEPILARHIAALARLRLEQGDAGDPASLSALYVRPSDAELKSNVDNPKRS
jgi:tRNA threonylcarbamoyladenosine biosynthesis protein TsaB